MYPLPEQSGQVIRVSDKFFNHHGACARGDACAQNAFSLRLGAPEVMSQLCHASPGGVTQIWGGISCFSAGSKTGACARRLRSRAASALSSTPAERQLSSRDSRAARHEVRTRHKRSGSGDGTAGVGTGVGTDTDRVCAALGAATEVSARPKHHKPEDT